MPSANVLTGYGPPETLRWQKVRPAEPAAGQIRMRVRAAGIGPTDLAIRRGNLKVGFALAPDRGLGFEAPGVVDALAGTASDRWSRSGRSPLVWMRGWTQPAGAACPPRSNWRAGESG